MSVRVVRWRVKDMASCFYACGLPSEEEEAKHGRRSSSWGGIGQKRRTAESRIWQEGDVMAALQGDPSVNNSNVVPPEKKASSDSGIDEDDYIIFCLRDDGAIRFVEDKKSEAYSDNSLGKRTSRRHVSSRKILYCENVVNRLKHDNDYCIDKDEVNSKPKKSLIFVKKNKREEEEGKEYADSQTSSPGVEMMRLEETHHYYCDDDDDEEEEETEECIMESTESSETNKSDASTSSSFTFPVLQLEWMGSPVMMPRPKKFHLRNEHKAQNARLRCCTF